ncbi:MAG: RHS repeat-associated core domain-containing protein [Microthrixaceae bacterium]
MPAPTIRPARSARRTAQRSCGRAVLTVLVACALVAGCTEHRTPNGEATGRTQSGSAGDPEALSVLVPATGTGASVPVYRHAVVDGTMGTSTSVEPLLVWPGRGAGRYRFEIGEVGDRPDRRNWSSGDVDEPRWQVPADALRADRVYLWSARELSSGEVHGPFVVRVDPRRDEVQPVDDAAVDGLGLGVARASGEAVFAWRSPSVASLAGDVSVGVEHRPGTPSVPGLPAGWRLTTSDSTWTRLVDNGDGTLTAESSSGLAVVFESTGDGSWRAVWGAGQEWPAGRFSDLVSEDDGRGGTAATLTLTDADGTITRFDAPAAGRPGSVRSVFQPGRPEVEQRWEDGRLRALVDPVAPARPLFTVSYAGGESYGGGNCPARSGAPEGGLCGLELLDGTVVSFVWGPVGSGRGIVRIVEAAGAGRGAGVTDLAFDAAGRLARLRSPLATAAVAAGVRVDGPDATTEVAHDADGRVVTVTGPAPVAGAPRPVRTYGRSFDGGSGRQRSTVTVDGTVLSTMEIDPATFQTLRSFDAAGRSTEMEWDRARNAVRQVIEPGDVRTTTGYDDLGNAVERVGPATDDAVRSGSAPRTRVDRDRTYLGPDDRDGSPMTGLTVTRWSNGAMQGEPAVQEVGPKVGEAVPDAYDLAWDEGPSGAGPWSARLTGVIRFPGDGPVELGLTTGTALFVADRPCAPTCTIDAVAGRPVRIRVDVRVPEGGRAGVTLTWNGLGRSGTVPSSALAPALGRHAAVSVADSFLEGIDTDARGRITWSDPVAGIPAATFSDEGLGREALSEPWDPGAGRFARVTGYVQPDGQVRRLEYHPADAGVTEPCTGRSVVQRGLQSANVDPAPDGGAGGGLRSEVVHDALGRPAATRSGTSGWTCITRDRLGRTVEVEVRAPGGDRPVSTTLTNWAAGGDPTVRTTTVRDAGGEHRSRSRVDLLGRVVVEVDLAGTTVATTYHPQFTDRVLTVTARPRQGVASVTTNDYTPSGALARVTTDGRPLVDVGYDDLGRTATLTYGNGARTAFDYDANARPVTRTVRTPSGAEYRESRSLTPSGRVLVNQLDAPEGRAGTTYTYDANARLVQARLDTTLDVSARAWEYRYDGNGNRTSERVTAPGGAVAEFVATFDAADRLTSTTDPAWSGAVTHDADGRITAVGPLTIRYDQLGNVAAVRHADGSEVAWGYVGAERVSRTVTRPGAPPVTVRFDRAGNVLDAAGAVIGRQVAVLGGVQLVTRGAGATWTFGTLGGNRWFALDGSGNRTGPLTLFDPWGRRITPAPPTAPTPAAPPTTAPTTAAPTTAAPTTAAPTTAVPTTTAAPTTTVASDGAASGSIAGSAAGAGAPPGPDDPLVDPMFQLGDTQFLGGLAVQVMGDRLYLPGLGRFAQPDPVPGAASNAYGYTDGDPVNSHDRSGNVPDWDTTKWILFGTIVVASIALSVVAAPAAGALIGAKIAGAAAVTGKAAIAQVATTALTAAAIGAGADVATQAVMTQEDFTDEYRSNQTLVAAGLAMAFSGYQAARDLRAAAKTLTASRLASQADDPIYGAGDDASNLANFGGGLGFGRGGGEVSRSGSLTLSRSAMDDSLRSSVGRPTTDFRLMRDLDRLGLGFRPPF